MISSRRYFWPLFFLSISSLFLGCAEVAGPPGGPKDETPPTIASTNPLQDAVNVNKDNRITISFSESVDHESIKEALFITPRQSGDLKYKWKKNDLTVILPDSFKINNTYIINIGSTVKDIHGNRLENSYSFAFSTGDKIDRGEISGFIYSNEKAATGISIGLYDPSVLDTLENLDSVYAPYITQSGKEGEFKFEFVPNGDYLPLAFEDKNKNQLLNYPAEKFGVPPGIISLTPEKPTNEVNIILSSDDTTSQSFLSVSQTDNNLVKIRLSRPVSANRFRENLKSVFFRSESEDIPIDAIKETGDDKLSTFNLYSSGLQDGEYRVVLGKDFIFGANDSSVLQSQSFSFARIADSLPPVIEYFTHNGELIFPKDAVLECGFSEPMNQTANLDSGLVIYDLDENRQELNFDWLDYFHLRVEAPALDWGKKFYAVFDQRLLSDLSGNSIGDTISVFDFSTYDLDSLGEVSGEVVFKIPPDSGEVLNLILKKLGGKERFTMPAEDRSFHFQVPAGKYMLSGFLDRNGNGQLDAGSLSPFAYSEKMNLSADTIRVRNRFETAGIVFEF